MGKQGVESFLPSQEDGWMVRHCPKGELKEESDHGNFTPDIILFMAFRQCCSGLGLIFWKICGHLREGVQGKAVYLETFYQCLMESFVFKSNLMVWR